MAGLRENSGASQLCSYSRKGKRQPCPPAGLAEGVCEALQMPLPHSRCLSPRETWPLRVLTPVHEAWASASLYQGAGPPRALEAPRSPPVLRPDRTSPAEAPLSPVLPDEGIERAAPPPLDRSWGHAGCRVGVLGGHRCQVSGLYGLVSAYSWGARGVGPVHSGWCQLVGGYVRQRHLGP